MTQLQRQLLYQRINEGEPDRQARFEKRQVEMLKRKLTPRRKHKPPAEEIVVPEMPYAYYEIASGLGSTLSGRSRR